jgi:two-component system nitrate/nitrite response regulator NarL
VYREGLVAAIRARPELDLVGAADGGRSAIDKVFELHPGVALVDTRMPDVDGLEVLAAIQRGELHTQVLLISAFSESTTVYRAMQAGAAGFLHKSADRNEICDAVCAVARGETVISDAMQGVLVHEIRVLADETRSALSPREREVLRLAADGLTAAQIGAQLHLAASTVKTHLVHLYGKLGVSDRAAAVAEAFRRGLLE